MSVEYRILGPVEVDLDDGRPAPVPRGRARDLLCLLLAHRREAVTADQIVDGLWADAPPVNARNAVQVVASRLRAAIGVDAVGSTAAGYTLAVDPAAVDADRFEALARRGRDEAADGRAREAAATLRAALELWRGPPLADVAGAAFAQPEVARLEALRLRCTADRIAADFATGAEVAGELEALVAEHPLDERLRELLMRALYRAGRQADALAVYRDARRALLEGSASSPGRRCASSKRRSSATRSNGRDLPGRRRTTGGRSPASSQASTLPTRLRSSIRRHSSGRWPGTTQRSRPSADATAEPCAICAPTARSSHSESRSPGRTIRSAPSGQRSSSWPRRRRRTAACGRWD